MPESYMTEIPLFLRKANDKPQWKKPNRFHVNSTMDSALNRYEKQIKVMSDKKEGYIKNTKNCVEQMALIHDLENTQRKKTLENTIEFVKAQIRENVKTRLF